jgi:hypothetical protein
MDLNVALESLRIFVINLKRRLENKPEPSPVTVMEKLLRGDTVFSSEALGGVMLLEADGLEYRELVRDMYLAVARKFGHAKNPDELHVGKGTIESAIQLAILRVLDIPKLSTEPFEKRLATSLAELKATLLKKPEPLVVDMEVRGLAPDGLPYRFGDIEFYVADGTSEDGQRRGGGKSPTHNPHEGMSAPPSKEREFKTLSTPTKWSIYAKVLVEATDTVAAKVLAERKLRLTLDALNFFGDIFGVMESRVILPGDATVSDVKTFVSSRATAEKHVSLGFRNLSSPFSFASIGASDAKKSGLERVNSMLANPSSSSLDEKILSSLQWAGRASIEGRREEAFLLFCVSLEALLLSKQSTGEITQTFALRGAHLLVGDAAHRKEIFRDLKSLYGIRSSIVHSGHTQVAEADLSKIRWLAKTALLIMLVREPFSRMKTQEELEEWFQTQLLAGTVSVSSSREGATEQAP